MKRDILTGGDVHTVERVQGENGSYIMKTRHNGAPSGLPSMVISASDVVFEARALKDAYSIMPKNFPKVIDDTAAMDGRITMSELFPNTSINLKTYLQENMFDPLLTTTIARLIGTYHHLADEKIEKSTYRQRDFFKELLSYRYGMLGIPQMEQVIDDIISDDSYGVIHGGLSPKNILIDTDHTPEMTSGPQVAFVDLETSCYGNRYFDIGFNLGHLILHGFDQGVNDNKIYDLYIESYFTANPHLIYKERLLKRVVTATMLYRLTHPEAKYSLKSFGEKRIQSFCRDNIRLL